MNKYGILTIFSTSMTDEQREADIEKYSKMMEKDGGKVLVVNKWGLKKFAYPINYKNEGFYVLFEFENTEKVPNEISALMNIDENILRSLCIRKVA